MSDFFDTIGKRISDTVDDLGKKAGDTIYIQKKKMHIVGGLIWDMQEKKM